MGKEVDQQQLPPALTAPTAPTAPTATPTSRKQPEFTDPTGATDAGLANGFAVCSPGTAIGPLKPT